MKRKTKPNLDLLFKKHYKGFKMEVVATREGSLRILQSPSRMGNKLYYPNGEVRNVDGANRNH